ncbi:MAG: phosphate signaling complex protein PhoU [Acidobacteriota bacterium]|nr:phosphate signaling complex protein PhoU [Blastocatellia bacterium]MDW8412236.1 phosphate signaling complex protein PhoU [Acidobacteriota bacterium]
MNVECLVDGLSRMGVLAEEALALTVSAVLGRSNEAAVRIISSDDEIDRLENEVETAVREFLVSERPSQLVLRRAVTVIHAAPVIERIADHATNIAKHALVLNAEPQPFYHERLNELMSATLDMVRESIAALIAADIKRARQTLRKDDLVDEIYKLIYKDLVSYMERHPQDIRKGTELLFIIKHLERIADYATNLCEMVVFMVEGRIIRHTKEAN